ncbi:MAG: response regulator transcription factor [Salinimicrobium sediminis]|uniref:Two component transcriptional regulator, LuxR family n=1 Tax=Salinimicrobium sediminis TaxID=1343891 RepID=A0A285X094_9FLAO|nr:response regulator transcription factor [Salinimicrobium sediminis]MDX1602189.1 response regulator transcription factor [Salinimicrobium sediminis]MDX1752389.1 response regulator transcription factor [Salinimicrobium sediminis]SOC78757.1 two component transcriptional regulator, LuxR family [Salinimicrobium sediminis]
MTKILIADHHPITRMGISSLLEKEGVYEVVGKVTNGKDLFKALKSKNPDVVILEIDLPDINGITALRTIKAENPGTKILILSCHPEEMYALNAIKAGAAAYLSKTASTDILKEAVHQVARGGIYLNKEISEKINSGTTRSNNLVSRYKKLSTREIEVLNLLSTGKRNKDIAEALDINEKTVSTYKTRLLKKLRVDNLADLINQSRLLQIRTTT